MFKKVKLLLAFASCLFLLLVIMPTTTNAFWFIGIDVEVEWCWTCLYYESGQGQRYGGPVYALATAPPSGGTKIFVSKSVAKELDAIKMWGLYGGETPPRGLKCSAQGAGDLSDPKFKILLKAHPKAVNIATLSKDARKALEKLLTTIPKWSAK